LPIGTWNLPLLGETLSAMKLKQQTRNTMKPSRWQPKLGLPALLAATTLFASDLTIEVSGITPDRGKIYVAVYDGPETFPISGRQRVGQFVDAQDRHLILHFKDLPPGHYAAVAFQDVNGNNVLDKNFLGIPKEPYGFSNGARGAGGAPKFSDAAIMLEPDGTTFILLK